LSAQEIVDETAGKTYKLKVDSVKATSQKLQETVSSTGNISTEYSANILASIVATSGGGDETQWNYDDPYGFNAKIYVHVIYSTDTVDGFTIYKITSLSGKLEKLDSQVVLTKIEIAEKCLRGKYLSPSQYEGQGQYNMTAYANNPSNNTYYLNNSLSPYYWNVGDSTIAFIQGTTTGYFSRAGTSWSASVTWER
jgi:hypothetical protein